MDNQSLLLSFEYSTNVDKQYNITNTKKYNTFVEKVKAFISENIINEKVHILDAKYFFEQLSYIADKNNLRLYVFDYAESDLSLYRNGYCFELYQPKEHGYYHAFASNLDPNKDYYLGKDCNHDVFTLFGTWFSLTGIPASENGAIKLGLHEDYVCEVLESTLGGDYFHQIIIVGNINDL